MIKLMVLDPVIVQPMWTLLAHLVSILTLCKVQTTSKSGISKKKLFVANVQTFSLEPSCFSKAFKISEWQKAMSEEV